MMQPLRTRRDYGNAVSRITDDICEGADCLMGIDDVEEICPSCAEKMRAQGITSARMSAIRSDIKTASNILKIGDTVMIRGSRGKEVPKKSKITGISLMESPNDTDGEDVKWAFWKDVKAGRVIVDYTDDGGKKRWAYGYQISRK